MTDGVESDSVNYSSFFAVVNLTVAWNILENTEGEDLPCLVGDLGACFFFIRASSTETQGTEIINISANHGK